MIQPFSITSIFVLCFGLLFGMLLIIMSRFMMQVKPERRGRMLGWGIVIGATSVGAALLLPEGMLLGALGGLAFLGGGVSAMVEGITGQFYGLPRMDIWGRPRIPLSEQVLGKTGGRAVYQTGGVFYGFIFTVIGLAILWFFVINPLLDSIP